MDPKQSVVDPQRLLTADHHKKKEGSHVPTEEQVCLSATLPQHMDEFGTKVEDLGGTGDNESLGG